jgi:hypothetical protein
MHLIAGVRGATAGLMAEVVEGAHASRRCREASGCSEHRSGGATA